MKRIVIFTMCHITDYGLLLRKGRSFNICKSYFGQMNCQSSKNYSKSFTVDTQSRHQCWVRATVSAIYTLILLQLVFTMCHITNYGLLLRKGRSFNICKIYFGQMIFQSSKNESKSFTVDTQSRQQCRVHATVLAIYTLILLQFETAALQGYK